MIFAEVLDVVGEDGVEIADAIRAGEIEIGAIIFVEQGDAFAEETVFGEPVAEVIGEGTGEPNSHGGAGLAVEVRKWRGDAAL